MSICGCFLNKKNTIKINKIDNEIYDISDENIISKNIFVDILNKNSLNTANIFLNENVILSPSTYTFNLDTTYSISLNGYLLNKKNIIKKIKEKVLVNSLLLNNITFEDLENVTDDAKIILISYILLNEKCLEVLEGAFSFVIFDPKANHIFAARDALGLKPMYYTQTEYGLCFADKIKYLLSFPNVTAKIGKDEICEIFGLGPAHTPGKTYFKDILELTPGSYLIYNTSGLTIASYWDLNTTFFDDTIENVISNAKKLVIESTQNNIEEAQNIAAMLSGGLDSSILCTIAKNSLPNLNTFSVNYLNNDNDFFSNLYQPTKDSDYVKIMTDELSSKHTNITISPNELYLALKDTVIARDAPGMADIDSSLYVFLKKIKEAGFNTCISGECSDEIFGGYPWYYNPKFKNLDCYFPWSNSLNTRKGILNKSLVKEYELENYVKEAYFETVKNVVYNSSSVEENEFRKTCYLTIKWFMQTLVERTEKISSMLDLDVRVPFASKEIFEYIYNIPAKFKLGKIEEYNIDTEKYVLRKAFEDNLPKEVINRKKSPYPKSYDKKYLELLEEKMYEILSDENALPEPILQLIDKEYILEMLSTHGNNLTENLFGQLMTYPQTLAYIIQINIWLKEYNVKIIM